MLRLDRIAKSASKRTVETAFALAHVALAERRRARERRQLVRGTAPVASQGRPRPRAAQHQAP